MSHRNRRLYVDLDGVLADFNRGCLQRFGWHPRQVTDDVLWKHLNATPDFFGTLEPCAGAIDAFHGLRWWNPAILTACPRKLYTHVANAKRDWVHRHLGKNVTVLPVQGGRNKPLFMHAPGDILIDDHARNIAAWEDAGGIGLLHRGDWNETEGRLIEVTLRNEKPVEPTRITVTP